MAEGTKGNGGGGCRGEDEVKRRSTMMISINSTKEREGNDIHVLYLLLLTSGFYDIDSSKYILH